MATIPFTTWAEMLGHLLDLYRNHSFGKASASIGGDQVSWSSAAELRAAIDHARFMAASETGAVTGFRAYAKNGGRG